MHIVLILPLVLIGRYSTHCVYDLIWLVFLMICFPDTDMLYLRLWLRGK